MMAHANSPESHSQDSGPRVAATAEDINRQYDNDRQPVFFCSAMDGRAVFSETRLNFHTLEPSMVDALGIIVEVSDVDSTAKAHNHGTHVTVRTRTGRPC